MIDTWEPNDGWSGRRAVVDHPSTRQRTAKVAWLTGPPDGTPRLSVGSASISALPLSLDLSSRNPLTASPGELLAAATGSVLAWLIAHELVVERTQARELVVEVTLTGPEGKPGHIPSGPFFTSIAVDVEGFVPRIDQEGFERVSRVAVDRCMQGLHINDDLHVTVQAELLGA